MLDPYEIAQAVDICKQFNEAWTEKVLTSDGKGIYNLKILFIKIYSNENNK